MKVIRPGELIARAEPWSVPSRFPRSRTAIAVLVMSVGVGAAVGQKPLVVVGLIGLIGLALGAAVHPHIATIAALALLYSNALVVGSRFHGVPSAVGFVISALFLVPLGYHVVVQRKPLLVPRAAPWVLVYVLVQVASAALSSNPSAASSEVATLLVEGVALFVLVPNVIRSESALRQAVWTLLLVGAAMGSLTILQQATQTLDTDYGGFAQLGNQQAQNPEALARAAGPIGEQNRYGQVLLVLIPLGLSLLWDKRCLRRRALAMVATAAVTGGMIFTYSRGGAVGLAVMLGVMAAMRLIRWRQLTALLLISATLLVVSPQYRDRLSTLNAVAGATAEEGAQGAADSSARSRVTENLAAILVFIDHPAFGVGPGVFAQTYPDYAPKVGIKVRQGPRQAHNLYLGVAAESGALGLVTFLGILAVTLHDLHVARRRLRGTAGANLATGLTLAIVCYMASGLFLHLSYARYFWLLIALAAAAGSIASRIAAGENEVA